MTPGFEPDERQGGSITRGAPHPAACVVEAADEVVWWMPGKPQLPAVSPWVGEELSQLAAAGMHMADPAAEMAAMMAQWVRPILAARKQLVLMALLSVLTVCRTIALGQGPGQCSKYWGAKAVFIGKITLRPY